MKFYYKFKRASNYNSYKFQFKIDDELVFSTYQNQLEWGMKELYIESGVHTFQWILIYTDYYCCDN